MSTLSFFQLRLVTVMLCGGGSAWLLAAGIQVNLARLRLWAAEHLAELGREVGFLRLRRSAFQIALAQFGFVLSSALSLIAGSPLIASVLIFPCLCVTPMLHTRRARRVSEIEEQLDTWLRGLASALRATPSLGEAIEYSLSLVTSPLRDELDTLVKEQRLGTSLEEALIRMGQRVGSRTLQSALGTLRIGQRTGGDISKILERSATTLREMARLEGVVRVKTAEGKAQAYVLALLPVPLVALFHYVNPGFLSPLVEHPRGHLVIACAFVVWATSLVLMRRILRVDI